MQFIKITGGMKILDLGCGSGYLSFPTAERCPDCEVIGLDIVSNALNVNHVKVEEKRLNNLLFVSKEIEKVGL